jgi:hypothetical protein
MLESLLQFQWIKRTVCLQHAGEPPPVPIRGLKTIDEKEGAESNEEEEPLNIRDVMPHADISSLITESLLSDLRDRDWKVSMFIIIMCFAA